MSNLARKIYLKIVHEYNDFSERYLSAMRRKKLNNTDFTIISNNCWAGSVYRRYGLPYQSPTAGLYFFAEEYIKFVKDLKAGVSGDVKIIPTTESHYYEALKRKGHENKLIGLINNEIEVVFLHYSNPEIAIEKWKRRCQRVNFDNLIVKFSEMDECEERHISEFCKLPYKKKLLLLAKKNDRFPEGIVVKKYSDGNRVTDDTSFYASFVNLLDLINR